MKDPVDFLSGLLASYSPTNFEGHATDFLLREMQEMGFAVWCDEAGNAIGTIGCGEKEILLLGHIDTVPGEIPVHCEGDRLFGRGAVDAKGPLACFATAASRVTIPGGWRITVIGAVGEEGDSRGAKHLCELYPAPEMVIIGEPSGWDHITLGYKGSMRCEYSIDAPLAHTAANRLSACDQAFHFWNGILDYTRKLNEGRERVFDEVSPSLREFGSGHDHFVGSANLIFGLRIPVEIHRQEIEAVMETLAKAASIKVQEYIPAYRGEKNNALVRGLLFGIRAAGGKPGFTLKTGTSDMNLVGPQWNCPIVAYGPGDSGLDHTPEEHILVSEFLTAVEVLSLSLEKIMQNEK